MRVEPGDRFVIETPGGGGYRTPRQTGGSGVDESKIMPSFVPVASGSVAATRSLAEQV